MSPIECEPGVAETSGKLVELGKSDTETRNTTTMIYTHVLNRGGKGVFSPADRL
jgi:hypothetical protein